MKQSKYLNIHYDLDNKSGVLMDRTNLGMYIKNDYAESGAHYSLTNIVTALYRNIGNAVKKPINTIKQQWTYYQLARAIEGKGGIGLNSNRTLQYVSLFTFISLTSSCAYLPSQQITRQTKAQESRPISFYDFFIGHSGKKFNSIKCRRSDLEGYADIYYLEEAGDIAVKIVKRGYEGKNPLISCNLEKELTRDDIQVYYLGKYRDGNKVRNLKVYKATAGRWRQTELIKGVYYTVKNPEGLEFRFTKKDGKITLHITKKRR